MICHNIWRIILEVEEYPVSSETKAQVSGKSQFIYSIRQKKKKNRAELRNTWNATGVGTRPDRTWLSLVDRWCQRVKHCRDDVSLLVDAIWELDKQSVLYSHWPLVVHAVHFTTLMFDAWNIIPDFSSHPNILCHCCNEAPSTCI